MNSGRTGRDFTRKRYHLLQQFPLIHSCILKHLQERPAPRVHSNMLVCRPSLLFLTEFYRSPARFYRFPTEFTVLAEFYRPPARFYRFPTEFTVFNRILPSPSAILPFSDRVYSFFAEFYCFPVRVHSNNTSRPAPDDAFLRLLNSSV